ncbi:hypothetical protein [Telluribacter sp. SYSU D00476]|uniref:hypothetical protein n=1 Tax=Telluribacter sp. SYSU D00476 TaxID=2811430 RepID=UPI001FF2F3F5|nr:hypothetical protein [Telluribacter sp. SYSU D00476]
MTNFIKLNDATPVVNLDQVESITLYVSPNDGTHSILFNKTLTANTTFDHFPIATWKFIDEAECNYVYGWLVREYGKQVPEYTGGTGGGPGLL